MSNFVDKLAQEKQQRPHANVNRASIDERAEKVSDVFNIEAPSVKQADFLTKLARDMLGIDDISLHHLETHKTDIKSFKEPGAANRILYELDHLIESNENKNVKTEGHPDQGKVMIDGEQVTEFRIVAGSEGNHAQAVSKRTQDAGDYLAEYGITDIDIRARVSMSDNSSLMKREETYKRGLVHDEAGNIKEERTEVVIVPLTEVYDAADADALAHMAEAAEKGVYKVLVPPFGHEQIVEGAGICAKHMNDAVPEMDTVLVPLGGGGFTAGVATYFEDSKVETYGIGTAMFAGAPAAVINGEPIPVRLSDEEAHPDAPVGGATIKEAGKEATDLLRHFDTPLSTAHPDQLVWILDKYTQIEMGCEGGIKEYCEKKEAFNNDKTLDDPGQLPELAAFMGEVLYVEAIFEAKRIQNDKENGTNTRNTADDEHFNPVVSQLAEDLLSGKAKNIVTPFSGGNITLKDAQKYVEIYQSKDEFDSEKFPQHDTPFYHKDHFELSAKSYKDPFGDDNLRENLNEAVMRDKLNSKNAEVSISH